MRSRSIPGVSRPGAGFTLFELLVVLAILGLSLAVVVPRLGPSPGAEARASARTIAAGLRQTRSLAVAGSRPQVFSLDVEGRTFGVGGSGRRGSLSESVALTLYGARAEQRDRRVGGIRFFPDGSSTGGRVTVRAGDATLRVDVDWMTGRVRVRDGQRDAAS